MGDDFEDAALMSFYHGFHPDKLRKEDKCRWLNKEMVVHQINQVRYYEGAWMLLIERFCHQFPEKHQQCLQVSKGNYVIIISFVRPAIDKQDTHLR